MWKNSSKFVRLRAKPCNSYLIDDGSEDKKEKGTIKLFRSNST